MEERPAGKEKKRKTMREEDRRWKRLPWPGPQSLTRDEEPPDPHQPNHHPAVRHSEEADDKGMLEKKRSKKNNFVFSSLGCQFTTKLPGCHLATILVALLSILVRPTVGGEDLIEPISVPLLCLNLGRKEQRPNYFQRHFPNWFSMSDKKEKQSKLRK